jgi:hypothetical protein
MTLWPGPGHLIRRRLVGGVGRVDPGEMITSLLVTMLVFWLAMSTPTRSRSGSSIQDLLTWREVWNIAKHE